MRQHVVGDYVSAGPAGSGVISNSSWDGVGTIVVSGFNPGTATLIDSTHLLTAAHLVYDGATQTAFSPSQVSFTLDGNTFSVSNVAVDPNYTGTGSSDATSDRYDIAVVTLTKPITNVTTYAYNTGTVNELTAGSAYMVGYGVGGDGTNGANPSQFPFGTKRLGETNLSLVTTSPQNLTDSYGASATLPPGVIAWDFVQYDPTAPGGPPVGPLGDTAVGPDEADSTNGDSGGPIFQWDAATGQYIITGISIDGIDSLSRFGDISWATEVSAYSGFIDSIDPVVPEPTLLGPLFLGSLLVLSRRRRRA
jgi:hypothetical protein